jgi:hypothetical protein
VPISQVFGLTGARKRLPAMPEDHAAHPAAIRPIVNQRMLVRHGIGVMTIIIFSHLRPVEIDCARL